MPEVPPVPRAPTLLDAVSDAFAEGGTLARVLPAFEARPAQRDMAGAVAETFDKGGVLLAEAETGTGKTLAYLAPAVLSGHRVLISTGTKNLQEQIYFKDLPQLRAALGIDFSATYMKGRNNYLCLHRFDALREILDSGSDVARPMSPAERVFLPIIERWSRTTETGDKAEIEDLPEDLPVWASIAASAENCLGTDCPQYDSCFVTRMRQRAAESDLVIVNHHLLCADAAVRQSAYGEVIPACSHAVIDEAHQLEDIATQYFGISVSNYRLEELVRDVNHVLARKDALSSHMELRRAAEHVSERSSVFFGALATELFASSRSTAAEERIRLAPHLLAPVFPYGVELIGALEALAAVIRPPDAAAGASPPTSEALEDLDAMVRRATEIKDELRFVLKASDADYVFFLELRGRGVFLRASPIDVSAIVRDLLLDRFRGTVLTSATLSVDESFDYIRARLGIKRAREVRLSSEFDYARQAILYLPPRMPDPRSPSFSEAAAREVVEILRRTEGRAFVLFTSYAMLRAVLPMAETALSYPILVQGTAPRSILLHQFRTTANAVLMATSSFWQGVDVIGEALSCVIIDKLPFASPGDPVTAARIEAIGNRGGKPFADYQVPLAILTLKQGLGRLIRHRNDRGVLSILDPRIRTMAYGRRFLDSLPPAPVTSSLTAVGAFFKQSDDAS